MMTPDQEDVFVLPERLPMVVDPFYSQQSSDAPVRATPETPGRGDEGVADGALARLRALLEGLDAEQPVYFEGAGWLDPRQLVSIGPGELLYANDYGVDEAIAAWSALDPGTQSWGDGGGLWVYNNGGGFTFLPA